MTEKETILDKKELENCLTYLEIARGISPSFEDTYFNMGKVYMYLYLHDQKQNEKLVDEGIRITKVVDLMNPDSKGYLYVLRNLYEAKGDINHAKEINSKLNGAGDSNKIGKLYDSYLQNSVSQLLEIKGNIHLKK